MVTKRSRSDSATNWAQGGIAAVLDPADSFEAHVKDTMGTGGGLAHRDVVEMVVRDGPARIRELMDLGAQFSQEGNRSRARPDSRRRSQRASRRSRG